jgi:hypothetical protein
MSAQLVPVLNKKLEGFTNEELHKELAVRRAMLAAWTGTSSAAGGAHAAPAKAAAPAATPPRRRARRRKAGAKKGAAAKKPTAKTNGAAAETPSVAARSKRRARRGISPSGKTVAQYAIEALASLGGARAPADLVPLMKKAGWVSKSSDETAVVTTTMKKVAAQNLVKKLGGQNKFRALRSGAE